jgi:hypothetical protein
VGFINQRRRNKWFSPFSPSLVLNSLYSYLHSILSDSPLEPPGRCVLLRTLSNPRHKIKPISSTWVQSKAQRCMHSLCNMVATNIKYKDKYKWKAHAHPKKEGYTKTFTDASRSKGEKGRKGEKCTYCHKGFHSESACMQKKIDLMSQILQQNNLGDHIPEGEKKKKPEDPNSKKGNSSHALIAINSSFDAWIIDSGASHHMAGSEAVYSSLDACKVLPILMGTTLLSKSPTKEVLNSPMKASRMCCMFPSCLSTLFMCIR